MSWLAKMMEKKRLEKLRQETWHSWGAGAFLNDKRGGVLWRAYDYSHSHPGIKKWLRKCSNRRFRRRKNEYWREDTLQRSQHKKSFDLWWELW